MKLKNLIESGKFLLSGFAALAITSCGSQSTQEQQQERAELVEVSVIKESEISRNLEFSTTLQGYLTMNVAPSVTGRIEHIYVEVGTPVKQGADLVRMDQNQYNTTKLAYANLGIEMNRLETLRQSGAVSEQVYDQTKLSYDQTKESLDFLERNTFFKAPFSGVVSAKNYEDGELYSGQAILTLTQISVLKALISVPESYFPVVKAGMTVNIESDIYPGVVFPSTIEVVYPTVDASSHTFQCKLRIPNSGHKLRPGMYVHTTMSMGQATVLVVPYSAVLKLTGSNDRYIFLDDNGTAKRVFVKMGQRFDQMVEIVGDSVKDGDRVVTVGQSRLVDGVKLNVTKEN